MRLFEAIVEANHRALAGDATAGLRPREFATSLPAVVLTCFDPRMHPLMPEVLGLPETDFLWLTNAGNVVTGPLSSTVRSLALACVVHGGREIAIIGHNDCQFFRPAKYLLAERLGGLGFDGATAAGLLDEFLRRLVDEQSNVSLAARFVRQSPLIDREVPVHGLMADVETGRLEWVVNGYETAYTTAPLPVFPPPSPGAPPPAPSIPTEFKIGGDLPPIGGG